MTRLLETLAAVCLIGAPSAALAHPVRHRHSRPPTVEVLPLPPSADAVELSVLAPPAPGSTDLVTFGDAAFARARADGRYDREERNDAAEEAAVGSPYPCDPRSAGPNSYRCSNDPRVRGYGQGYAFTPSYVSAPQVFRADPARQDSLLPETTGIFWGVSGLRFDPH